MTQAFSLFDLAPGKRFAERYEIVKPRRQTGLAAAFEARSEEGPCELLVFAPNLFEGPTQAEEYRDSWRAWAGVDSPHVLRVREVLSPTDNAVVLATDLPAGTSLRDWLKEHERVEAARAKELGLQLLSGLEAIHAAGLVHGDIKPQTVYLEDGEQRAVLVDGGITTGLWNAKHLGEHTALIGTPYYAPVEQFGGDSPNIQSDVYNLAAVLYELVAGVLPWSGKSILEVFQAKLEKRPRAIAVRAPGVEVGAELEEAIARGLSADRRQPPRVRGRLPRGARVGSGLSSHGDPRARFWAGGRDGLCRAATDGIPHGLRAARRGLGARRFGMSRADPPDAFGVRPDSNSRPSVGPGSRARDFVADRAAGRASSPESIHAGG